MPEFFDMTSGMGLMVGFERLNLWRGLYCGVGNVGWWWGDRMGWMGFVLVGR